MTSVEFFAVIFFGVSGYMIVDHWLKRDARRSARKDAPSPGKEGTAKADSHQQGDSPRGAEEDPPRPWWEILEVSPNASVDAIRRAYRLQVSKYHPDKVAHLAEEFKFIAERRAKEINAAYRDAMRVRGVAI